MAPVVKAVMADTSTADEAVVEVVDIRIAVSRHSNSRIPVTGLHRLRRIDHGR
jgi:hypothetical protein